MTRLYSDDLSIAFQMASFIICAWSGLCVAYIRVPAEKLQLSHLTSAIDSHQSADRSRFSFRSVGMKE